MELHLPFQIQKPSIRIEHSDKILTIGSCFTDHIGKKLESYKWTTWNNPYGTIFNPISIFKLLNGPLNHSNYLEKNSIFHHWDTHGEIAASSQTEFQEVIDKKNHEREAYIREADWIFITLGTSFVYRLKEKGDIVANCHKVPQSFFEKQLLSKEAIIQAFSSAHYTLTKENRNLKFLFTVSPVRHTRDGLKENHISKGILLQSISEIIESFPDTFYFPAYELVMDVLRDYRFFESDMIHPNNQAIDFLWELLKENFFTENARSFIEQWEPVKKALTHRPMFPKSNDHQLFVQKQLAYLKTLPSSINTVDEMHYFQEQINPT